MITVPQLYFRCCGWMLLLGSLIATAVMFLHLEDVPANLAELPTWLPTAVWTHIALLAAVLLVLMGLPGLYLRHAGRLRWWGWISFVLVFATILSETLHSVLQIFDYPVLFKDITDEAALKRASEHVMEVQMTQPGGTLMRSTFMMFLGGYVLLGLSMLQARTLSRWPALTALAFPLLMLVPMDGVPHQFMVIFNLFYLPFLWYGAILAFEPDFSRNSSTAAASSALQS